MHKYIKEARCQEGVEIKSIISLVLAKKVIIRYVQDVRAVRGMRRALSDHHVVLWIKRTEVVNGARRIRSEKLREQ